MTEREKGISSGDQLQATARLCSSPLVMSASAPVGFAEYSRATKSFLCSGASFCEVFSGPNAPLSQSMAIEHDSTVPGAAITKEGKGHKSELQALADVISKPMMVAKSTEPDHAIKRSKIGACEYRFLFAYATRCIEGLPPNQKKNQSL